MTGRGADYVVGAKNFSEQYILAELMAARIEAEGPRVRRKEGLGSAVIFRALAAGEIDAYVDYSGTLWTNVLDRRDMPPRAAMLAELTRFMRELRRHRARLARLRERLRPGDAGRPRRSARRRHHRRPRAARHG